MGWGGDELGCNHRGGPTFLLEVKKKNHKDQKEEKN